MLFRIEACTSFFFQTASLSKFSCSSSRALLAKLGLDLLFGCCFSFNLKLAATLLLSCKLLSSLLLREMQHPYLSALASFQCSEFGLLFLLSLQPCFQLCGLMGLTSLCLLTFCDSLCGLQPKLLSISSSQLPLLSQFLRFLSLSILPFFFFSQARLHALLRSSLQRLRLFFCLSLFGLTCTRLSPLAVSAFLSLLQLSCLHTLFCLAASFRFLLPTIFARLFPINT
jgi:hypothetical protein